MPRQDAVSKIARRDVNSFRKKILNWYDINRRTLPWRAPPGKKADPYHVWLSEIMLQQTVVAAVISYFVKFLEMWPTIHDLAEAKQEEVMAAWAGLGYYARARNLHKCAQEISRRGGSFPDNEESLKDLAGIGDYTAAAITAIAFDKPATVIDGNVERVIVRYYAIEEPLPEAKREIREKARFLAESRTDRPGDFAQAMMDLGATICIPKAPRCGFCPLSGGCSGYKKDIAGDLPRRRVKKKKPSKFGYVYWVTDRKGRVLFHRRPQNGIMGGMLGLPTSAWVEGKRPAKGLEGKAVAGLRVFHSFTHFDLELEGVIANHQQANIFSGPAYVWIDRKDVHAAGLPSLFKKFVRLIHDHEQKI